MPSKKVSSLKISVFSILALMIVILLNAAVIGIFRLTGTVSINGVKYDKSIREIDLSGSDISQDISSICKLSVLESANLTNTGITPAQYDTISANLPNCDIKWSVPICGKTCSSETQTFVLDSEALSDKESIANIRYLKNLKMLDATDCPLCDELYQVTAAVSSSDIRYKYKLSATMYGEYITNETKTLDLSDKNIDDVSEFYEKLKFFPDLSKIYVGDCNISDEEMDKLNRAYPNNQIVWLVEFGKWQVRTDIKVFSTMVGSGNLRKYHDNEFYPLLNYCTELRALDLGHNLIEDLNNFSKLTNLEILVLAGTNISDLSAIRNFKKLHYLELFDCKKITDLEPLSECQNLQEAELQNIGKVSNLASLQKCSKLKMLFGYNLVPTDYTWDEMREKMPDCQIVTKGKTPALGGWRETDKNQLIKTAFANWDKIVTYNNWDDVTYSEKVKLQPKYYAK